MRVVVVFDDCAVLVAARIASKDGPRHEHIHIVFCAFASVVEECAVGVGSNAAHRQLLQSQHDHDSHEYVFVHGRGAHILPRPGPSAHDNTQNIFGIFGAHLLHGHAARATTRARAQVDQEPTTRDHNHIREQSYQSDEWQFAASHQPGAHVPDDAQPANAAATQQRQLYGAQCQRRNGATIEQLASKSTAQSIGHVEQLSANGQHSLQTGQLRAEQSFKPVQLSTSAAVSDLSVVVTSSLEFLSSTQLAVSTTAHAAIANAATTKGHSATRTHSSAVQRA